MLTALHGGRSSPAVLLEKENENESTLGRDNWRYLKSFECNKEILKIAFGEDGFLTTDST